MKDDKKTILQQVAETPDNLIPDKEFKPDLPELTQSDFAKGMDEVADKYGETFTGRMSKQEQDAEALKVLGTINETNGI